MSEELDIRVRALELALQHSGAHGFLNPDDVLKDAKAFLAFLTNAPKQPDAQND